MKTWGLEHLVSEPKVEWDRRVVLGIRREEPKQTSSNDECKCEECGWNMWTLSYGSYELMGECLKCGHETTLYDG